MGGTCDQAIGELMSRMYEQTLRFFSQQLGMSVNTRIESGKGGCPALISALPIAGAMEGTIYLGAEERTVSDIMHRLIGDEVGAEEEPMLLRDTLNELLNVVVGNTTRSLDEIGLLIRVSSPTSVARNNGAAAALADASRRRRIETDSGTVILSFESGIPGADHLRPAS